MENQPSRSFRISTLIFSVLVALIIGVGIGLTFSRPESALTMSTGPGPGDESDPEESPCDGDEICICWEKYTKGEIDYDELTGCLDLATGGWEDARVCGEQGSEIDWWCLCWFETPGGLDQDELTECLDQAYIEWKRGSPTILEKPGSSKKTSPAQR